MRKYHYHWLGAAALLAVTLSCGEKKKGPDVIIAKKAENKASKAIQSMSEYTDSRQTEWVGSIYTVEVKRQKDTSLPVVTLDDKTRYYDNTIAVKGISLRRISRATWTRIHVSVAPCWAWSS